MKDIGECKVVEVGVTIWVTGGASGGGTAVLISGTYRKKN